MNPMPAALAPGKLLEGTVVGKRQWTERLFSLQVSASSLTFVAGQFARLALPTSSQPEKEPEMVGRPYSFVNSPLEMPHEFYFIVVDEGPLSPRLAALRIGDAIWLLPRANGFFSIREIPSSDVLWCLSTGTGIGPFLSILRTEEPWQSFARIILVHAVRFPDELTYREVIAGISESRSRAFVYVPVVSRERAEGALSGRIPALIDDGTLENAAGAVLAPDNSHVMLCGNPDMVHDTQLTLQGRGMRKHRRREPGQITVETYW